MKPTRHLRRGAVLCSSIALLGCAPAQTLKPPATANIDCGPYSRITVAELSAKIDPLVDDAIGRGFAGGVVVMKGGDVVYNRVAGSASLTEDVPVTEDTLFNVASIGKYFVATLALKAVEEELIVLDDSVGVAAPDIKLAARGVTLTDLLAHRSGLGSTYVAERETDQAKALAAIDAASYDPEKVGTFRYSNDGYDLLSILLERVYVRSFEDVFREKILKPACLDRPQFWSAIDVTDPTVVSQPLRALSADLRKRNYAMVSALMVTAEDLARYQAALARGAVLEQASLEELWAPRGKMSIGQATFGAFLSEHPALGRKFNARGYEDWGDNAILIHYLDQDIIVAVTTSRGPAEGSGAPPFRQELSDAIEEILASDISG